MLCEEEILDLDKINDYKPNGRHAFCKFDVSTYNINNIADKDYGTFIKTDDNGIIFFRDIVYKMMFDLALTAQLDNVKYLRAETGYDDIPEDAEVTYSRPLARKTVGKMFKASNIENVLMLDLEYVVEHNMLAIAHGDMMGMLCEARKCYTPEYMKACLEIALFINKHVYIKSEDVTFSYMCNALISYFCGRKNTDFKNFIENFYKLLDNIPKMKYTEIVAGTLESENDSITSATAASNADDSDATNEMLNDDKNVSDGKDTNEVAVKPKNSDSDYVRSTRRIKGSDITGFDETYTIGYCEELYNKAIENAEPDGLLDQVIISRLNAKAAPIDLLSETLIKEHDQAAVANWERLKMAEMRQSVMEAVEKQKNND